jgi:hypothetical protein
MLLTDSSVLMCVVTFCKVAHSFDIDYGLCVSKIENNFVFYIVQYVDTILLMMS